MISYTESLSAIVAVTLLLPAITVSIVNENEECDLNQGRWIYDESYPLYPSGNCPFIIQQFNCTGNGRRDLHYQKYRWQPNNCNLTRWDGVGFGKMVRGKRIMFVGDSISMNQWQSLACMLYAANPNVSYQTVRTGPLSTIVFPGVNVTLMYLRNVVITDIVIENRMRVLKVDSVAVSSKQWLQSDILIFDTWHWWIYTGRKQSWDVVREGNVTISDMDRFEAYGKALRTWGRWVDQNVDPRKVKIFFQGVSPDHWNASTWGMPEMRRCGGEQEPLDQPVEENNSTTRANIILKEILMSMNKTVHLLDIIELSQFRVDGHPSIYGNLKNRGMDCTHWCLPGIPDVWNELLYAALVAL